MNTNYVDTTKKFTMVELCAGYSGISLGLSRVIPNLRTVAFSEIEAYACANLVSKMEKGFLDPAPIWTDLKTFPWAEFCGKVDILTGGYPCQPFSSAGKRLGTEDPRHLWPYIATGIRLMRPNLCFFENVEGHITLGLREVITELEEIGYETTWGIFGANEVGAPHRRKRVFILAKRRELADTGFSSRCAKFKLKQEELPKVIQGGADVANSHSGRGGKNFVPTKLRPSWTKQSPSGAWVFSEQGERGEVTAWPTRPGQDQHWWEPRRTLGNASGKRSGSNLTGESEGVGVGVEEWVLLHTGECEEEYFIESPNNGADGTPKSAMGGDINGDSDWMDCGELFSTSHNRTDELRLLGNGVVPDTVALAFKTLFTELFSPTTTT